MDVLGIIEILESQDNEAAKKVLAVISKMFAPALSECEESLNCSSFIADIDNSECLDSSIDWEKRRYEIAKECVAAEVGAIQANKIGMKAYMPEIAKRSINMADALIEQLRK